MGQGPLATVALAFTELRRRLVGVGVFVSSPSASSLAEAGLLALHRCKLWQVRSLRCVVLKGDLGRVLTCLLALWTEAEGSPCFVCAKPIAMAGSTFLVNSRIWDCLAVYCREHVGLCCSFQS